MNDLDEPSSKFRSQLHQVADMVADMYADIENQEVYGNPDSLKVREQFVEPLPEYPTPIVDLLGIINEEVIPNSTRHYSPHFYPWVTSCASQASLLSDFLATALNVNSTTWMNSAASSEIERQTIQWVGQFCGYDENASGVFLSGGSTANLTGLQIARRTKSIAKVRYEGLVSQPQLTVYTSTEAHFCIDKSVDALGIGKNYLRKIKVLSDFTIDVVQLERQIQNDIAEGYLPICIVGNAGTVNTGAIDPLDALAAIAEKYGVWFHVDAAYGGCAANLPSTKGLFKGFDKADSMAIDLHKWLYVPFEAGCTLVKHRDYLRDTFKVIPEYQKFDFKEDTRVDYSEYSFQQSRNFKALKIWMNFKAYGREKLAKSIEGNIEFMKELSKLLENSTDFELVANGLSVVCFRYVGEYDTNETDLLNDLNLRIVKHTEIDKRVFIRETTLNGMVVLRGCCTNFRREFKHMKYLIHVLREIGKRMSATDLKGN